MKSSVCLVTLGCAKNLVDSEHMLGVLQAAGFPIVPELEEAEIAIINTCGFIQSAVEESIRTILDVAAMKSAGKLKRLYVAGCLTQRFGYKLKRGLPEVDGWMGTGELTRIAELLSEKGHRTAPFVITRPTNLPDHKTPRVSSSPFYSAYVKIAEGCSHRCTYCTIPSIRGPLRSRLSSSVLAEVREMAARGVKEINLIAQDTTSYGKDLGSDASLENLIEDLVSVSGIEWIRVLYSHPEGVSDRLLELMDSYEKVCPYLDIPLQHMDSGILERMGRPAGRQKALELLERIRSRKRPISLRTALMVGFPGETDGIFGELCRFVSRAQFDHLGVFVYSPEKGTKAARLGPAVERKIAEKRRDVLMRLQAGISLEKHRKMVGTVVPVLIEGVCEETDLLLRGRTAAMAPDVDAQVLINEGEGGVGEIVPVKIRQAHAYDLVGRILG